MTIPTAEGSATPPSRPPRSVTRAVSGGKVHAAALAFQQTGAGASAVPSPVAARLGLMDELERRKAELERLLAARRTSTLRTQSETLLAQRSSPSTSPTARAPVSTPPTRPAAAALVPSVPSAPLSPSPVLELEHDDDLAAQLPDMAITDERGSPTAKTNDGRKQLPWTRKTLLWMGDQGLKEEDKVPLADTSNTAPPKSAEEPENTLPAPSDSTEHAQAPVADEGITSVPVLASGAFVCSSLIMTSMYLRTISELDTLMVSSSLTEFSLNLQEVQTIIFEIQELRHQTTHSTPARRPTASDSLSLSSGTMPGASGAVNEPVNSHIGEVDAALMQLGNKLETMRKEFDELKTNINPLVKQHTNSNMETSFIHRKWVETLAEWEQTQRDADMLEDELKEDKWLVVFRTVSLQAEDMMSSLEKVLKQCHDFIWDLNHRRQSQTKLSSSTNSATSSSTSLSSSGTFRSPGRRNIGSPGSSPSQAASSMSYFFGEGGPHDVQQLLASFVALHGGLHAKVKHYSPACSRVLKILFVRFYYIFGSDECPAHEAIVLFSGKGIADRSTKNGEVLRRYAEMKLRWRNLTERISRCETEMNGVEELFREVATEHESRGTDKTPTSSPPNKMTGLKKFAAKMSSRSSTPTPGPTFSPSSSPPQTNTVKPQVPMKQPPESPPRPPRSEARMTHQYSHSANPDTVGPLSSATRHAQPRPSAARAVSPVPSADGFSKPRWNFSMKRTDEYETLRGSKMVRPSLSASSTSASTPGRKSFGGSTFSPPRSGRHSAMGLRSVSYGRPGAVSPTFSQFSESSSAYVRERPFTPSKIPGPSMQRGRSSTPFSSLDDPEPASLLQRAMTPTPSLSSSVVHLSVSPASSSKTSPSRPLVVPSGNLSPHRATSPTPSSISSVYMRGVTPEPQLYAQARRLSHVRLPQARPPPVPTIPPELRSAASSVTSTSTSTTSTPRLAPRKSSSARPMLPQQPPRPPSALSSSTAYRTPKSSEHYYSHAYSYHNSSNREHQQDPLDVEVSRVISSLPMVVEVQRVDVPTNPDAYDNNSSGLSAKYRVGVGGGDLSVQKPVVLKLVDKVGPRAKPGEKKVLAMIGHGWVPLENHCLDLLAQV